MTPAEYEALVRECAESSAQHWHHGRGTGPAPTLPPAIEIAKAKLGHEDWKSRAQLLNDAIGMCVAEGWYDEKRRGTRPYLLNAS